MREREDRDVREGEIKGMGERGRGEGGRVKKR